MSEELRKRLISVINDELISSADYPLERAAAKDAADTLDQIGGRGGTTRAFVESQVVQLLLRFASGELEKPTEQQWPAARFLSGASRTPDPRVSRLVEALLDTTASLTAAMSLLERSGKTAAPSDKMFDAMLDDYRASLSRARTALSEWEGEQ